MKLLVLGASGGVGGWLVRLAKERGHDVTALARQAAQLDAPACVRVIRDDVLDPTVLGAAVQGQDAVAACIGLRRAAKVPWAPLRSPADLTESVALTPARRVATSCKAPA